MATDKQDMPAKGSDIIACDGEGQESSRHFVDPRDELIGHDAAQAWRMKQGDVWEERFERVLVGFVNLPLQPRDTPVKILRQGDADEVDVLLVHVVGHMLIMTAV